MSRHKSEADQKTAERVAQETARQVNKARALAEETHKKILSEAQQAFAEKQTAQKTLLANTRQEQRRISAEADWLLVEQRANKLLEGGMEGYVGLDTALFQIFAGFKTLSKALNKSAPLQTLRDMLLVHLVLPVIHGKASPAINVIPALEGSFWTTDLKPLIVNVKFDEENGIDVSAVYDNEVFKPASGGEDPFKVAFVAWAMLRGYQMDKSTTPPVLRDRQTQEPMTAEVFETLNVDDEHGLKAFLTGQFKMDLEVSGPSDEASRPTF